MTPFIVGDGQLSGVRADHVIAWAPASGDAKLELRTSVVIANDPNPVIINLAPDDFAAALNQLID